jgi:hypothetical protein
MRSPANRLFDRSTIVGKMQGQEESLFEAPAKRDANLANGHRITVDLPDMRSGDNKGFMGL